jgi:hypothetical protein
MRAHASRLEPLNSTLEPTESVQRQVTLYNQRLCASARELIVTGPARRPTFSGHIQGLSADARVKRGTKSGVQIDGARTAWLARTHALLVAPHATRLLSWATSRKCDRRCARHTITLTLPNLAGVWKRVPVARNRWADAQSALLPPVGPRGTICQSDGNRIAASGTRVDLSTVAAKLTKGDVLDRPNRGPLPGPTRRWRGGRIVCMGGGTCRG